MAYFCLDIHKKASRSKALAQVAEPARAAECDVTLALTAYLDNLRDFPHNPGIS
jgi:hypothetical protein